MAEARDLESILAEAGRHLDEGENEQAERLYQEALEIEPENIEALNKVGVCRAREEDLETASEMFTRVLERDPRHVQALSNMGNIHYSRGEYDDAISLYKTAIDIDPDYGVAHNNLAAAYKKSGRYGEFVHHIKRSQRIAMKTPPPNPVTGKRGGCFTRAALMALGLLVLLWLL